MGTIDELFSPAPVAPKTSRKRMQPPRVTAGSGRGFALAASIGTLEIDAAIARGAGDTAVRDEAADEHADAVEHPALARFRDLVAVLDAAGPRTGLDLALQLEARIEADLLRRHAIAAAVQAQRTVGPPTGCTLDDERVTTACEHLLCAWCTPVTGNLSLDAAARIVDATGLKGDHVTDLAGQTVAAEHRLTPTGVRKRIERALALGVDFPHVSAALAAGRISRTHVDQIVRRTPTFTVGGEITAEDAAAFARAYDQGAAQLALVTSTAQFPPKLTALAERLNPRSLAERHTEAMKDRHVRVQLLDDGLADLIVRTDAVLAKAACNRILDIARAYRKTGADGTLGELAADQAMTMLLTSAEQTPLVGDTGEVNAFTGIAGAITARVAITMPFTSLLADTEHLGDLPELEGGTPIDPATARALLGNADEVIRVVTHPLTGVTITADSYRATASLRRFLGVRDVRCRWAGCARDGDDLDHTLDYQYGGKTTPENLEVLCKRHHTVKHTVARTTGERLWKVRHVDGDGLGRLEWVTPNGVVLCDDPPRSPGVIFVPTEQVDTPPPF